MRRAGLIAALFLAAGSAVAQVPADPADAVRTEFRTAYELARAGLSLAASDSGALRGYPLYPYLEAARLGRALDDTARAWTDADESIASFLALHDSEPVSENLRVAWLQSLATRDLWEPYLEHYRGEVADTGLRCRQLIARVELGDSDDIAPPVLDEWLTPYQLPAECEPLFQWSRNQQILDDDSTAARVRLLLENGEADFARTVARRLPEERARPLLAWADLIERPRESIAAHLGGPAWPIDADMLLDGWSRLARDNPDAALAMADDVRQLNLVTAAGTGPFELALALGLAWDRRPETLDAFARVPAALLDDYALGWQARAALWAGDAATAQRAIEAMSEAQRRTAQWRYWRARVSTDREEAADLYDGLGPDDNYFSAAAAAQQHDPAEVHPATHPADETAIAALGAQPGIVRARELRLVGLPIASAREWRDIYTSLDDDARAQSVHLAAGLGWYDVAITTATELDVFFDYALLYPEPYPDAVAAAASEFDVDPALIYAVMRQESLYRVDAESSAGALGLMQLRRGTARDVSRELGDAAPGGLDPLVPDEAIRLGTARLASLVERYDGLIVPALAAYNAGPAAVDRWLPAMPVAGDVWLENIPFNETRDYVRRVLWHSVVFAWREGDRADVREWLEDIGPP
jgi:soluble lytic murein transglycosylase